MRKIILALVLACLPSIAFAGPKEDDPIAWNDCLDKNIEMFNRHGREFDAQSGEGVRKIAKEFGDNKVEKSKALCKYALETYFKLYDKVIAEQKSKRSSICWTKVNEKALRDHAAVHRRYKSAIGWDCRNGGIGTPETESWIIKQ